jgi:antitoxin (DNA-binding transcriptional repressor) of toxin-antitoxin stability system
MIRLNIHEAKTHLSRHLKELEAGETILLCRRNIPIAEIRPLPQERQGKRPLGLYRGVCEIPESFFEPLPDDLLEAFEGRSS